MVLTEGGTSLTVAAGSRDIKDSNHLVEPAVQQLSVMAERQAVCSSQLILRQGYSIKFHGKPKKIFFSQPRARAILRNRYDVTLTIIIKGTTMS